MRRIFIGHPSETMTNAAGSNTITYAYTYVDSTDDSATPAPVEG